MFNNKVIRSSIWNSLGQISNQGINLITTIIIARLLSPIEFGQMGIIMVFISLFSIFIEGGIGGAVIRKKNVNNYDYSTIFITNIVSSVFFYIVLIILSTPISNFYNDIILKKIIIITGSIIIINSFQYVQTLILIRELKFKELTLHTLFATTISSFIGILLAFYNFSIWALVIMRIINSSLLSITLTYKYGLIKSFTFRKKSFKEFFKFGINTTLVSFVNMLFVNINQIVISKWFSLVENGFYFQSKKLTDVPSNILSQNYNSVIYSSLSKHQNNFDTFLQKYNYHYIINALLIFSLTSYLYVFSKEIIIIILGTKWIGCIIYLKYISLSTLFYTLESYNKVIYKIYNKTRLLLYLELLKKTIYIIPICISIYYKNITILLIGGVISSFISYYVSLYCYSTRIINKINLKELYSNLKLLIISIVTVVTLESIKHNITFSLIYYIDFIYKSTIFLVITLLLSYFILYKKQIKTNE